MITRFVRPIKSGLVLELSWQNSAGCKRHKASTTLNELYEGQDDTDFEEWQWATTCDTCQDGAPETAAKAVRQSIEYNTQSGTLEPGCIFWSTKFPADYFWDNHEGPHLTVVAPNGFHWVIDSRARDCGDPENRFHRCWRWIGDPEVAISVIQDDTTCGFGDPAVVKLGSWTGSLIDGLLVQQLPASLPVSSLGLDL